MFRTGPVSKRMKKEVIENYLYKSLKINFMYITRENKNNRETSF